MDEKQKKENQNRKCVGFTPQRHKWKYWNGGYVKECIKCGIKVLKTMSDKTHKSKTKEYHPKNKSFWR